NVICVVSYGAPIGQFMEIVKKKSAANYDGSPYVTCLLSSFLWLFYGLLDPDDGVLIVTVSVIGVASQTIYLALLLAYYPKEKKVKYTGFIIMDIVIFGTVIAITLLAFEESARRAFTGILTATFSVVSYAAPLTVVRTVMRTKSVEYMPFFLILTLFASGLAWTAFALLVGDFYVLVPNAAGIVLGAIQLIVYFIYMKRSSKAMADEGSADMVEEGDTMQDFDVDGVAKEKNQTLRSPSLSRQYSVKELVKTLSFIPNESRASLQPQSDVESGAIIKPPSLHHYHPITSPPHNGCCRLHCWHHRGTFVAIVKRKSAENYSGSPYITSLLSCSLWTFYGLLDPDDGVLIVTVNSIGVALQIIYIILLLIYYPKEKKVKYFGLVMLDVVFLGTVMAATLVAFHEGSRRTFVGVLCATFTVLMYASPLSVVRTVIKTESIEYMPIFLILSLFANGWVWFVFALLLKDFYVLVPNAVGIVLGSVQLIVYLMYKNKSSTSLPPPKSTEIMVEDGQTKMVKDIEGNNGDMLDFTEVGEAIGKIQSSIPDGPVPNLRNPSLSRQYSFRHFRSTASWGPNRSGSVDAFMTQKSCTFTRFCSHSLRPGFSSDPTPTPVRLRRLGIHSGSCGRRLHSWPAVGVGGSGGTLVVVMVVKMLWYPWSKTNLCLLISMASLSFIIGIIGCLISTFNSAGNVISILMFTSPIGTFRRVVKKKSTEDYKGLPYIITLLSTSLWTFYGLLKPDGLLVVTVNGAGAALQFIYVTLFLIYAPRDTKVKSMKLVALLNMGFLGSVIAVTLLAFHGSLRLTFVGVICAGLTIGMYASPLSAMRTVIKTESVEYMPFFLSFFQFLNGGVWSAYAVLIKDFYIGVSTQVPNGIGFVLGAAQLTLYALYKNKSVPSKSKEATEEEGSAHLVEMQGVDEDDEARTKRRSLNKGRSLPIPSRQHSFQQMMKTISLSPHHTQLPYEDVEKGDAKDNS
ncbi:hypothetical protein RJ640_024719, partial [Escallonia rubra]